MLEGALNPSSLVIVAVLVGLLPTVVAVVTPFLKVSIVLYILRNAFTTQQVPPTSVVNAIALIVSLFIMAPTISAMMEIVQETGFQGGGLIEILQSTQNISQPILDFMVDNTGLTEINFFLDIRELVWPADAQIRFNEDSIFIIIPSFVLSELKSAFLIGFLLYLPFIIIDVVVSSVLITIGMQTVNPNVITIPLKFLLFISIDGWTRLIAGIIGGYS